MRNQNWMRGIVLTSSAAFASAAKLTSEIFPAPVCDNVIVSLSDNTLVCQEQVQIIEFVVASPGKKHHCDVCAGRHPDDCSSCVTVVGPCASPIDSCVTMTIVNDSVTTVVIQTPTGTATGAVLPDATSLSASGANTGTGTGTGTAAGTATGTGTGAIIAASSTTAPASGSGTVTGNVLPNFTSLDGSTTAAGSSQSGQPSVSTSATGSLSVSVSPGASSAASSASGSSASTSATGSASSSTSSGSSASSTSSTSSSSPTPTPRALVLFDCNPNGYVLKIDNTIQELDLTAGTIVQTLNAGQPIVDSGSINALGYSGQENLLYGVYAPATGQSQLIQIGSNGASRLLAPIPILSDHTWGPGEIDQNGNYWILSVTNDFFARIDLTDPASPTYNTVVQSGALNPRPVPIQDWGWVADNTGGRLWTILASPTGVVVDSYFDTTGLFFVSAHSYGVGPVNWPGIFTGGDTLFGASPDTGAITRFDVLSAGAQSQNLNNGAPTGIINGARCFFA